jgi:hypothetical protein
MPYYVMIDRLRSFVRHRGRPVALFVIGYSFADEHINESIVESLRANPSAACFALQFGDLSNYPAAIALGKENANLSIFAPDQAIIRRQLGSWIAPANPDASGLIGVFDKVAATVEESGASAAKPAEDDHGPQPYRMGIGDFKRFGEFLKGIAAYAPHLAAVH